MIKSIHHIQLTIPPGQENEARQFYCELLGLTEIPKPLELKNKGGFWIQLGDIQIHISIQQNINRFTLNAHLCFEVSELEFWIHKLQSKEISLESNDKIPEGKRIMLRDPFGNRLELLERV